LKQIAYVDRVIENRQLMSSKIYTKTGDQGKTSLIGGTKVPKSHLRIEAYGTVDELNSFIGALNDQLSDGPSQKTLREVQDRLFTIGSSLACDPDKEAKMKLPDLKEEDVSFLEHEIDRMDGQLKPMKSFILPGGHPAVSAAHVARCVCRRAERNCVAMMEQGMFIDPLVIRYLNRLSDHLFVMARYTAFLLGADEIEWRPRVNTRPR
jgi:cob(I)alamin adenosyltransferase